MNRTLKGMIVTAALLVLPQVASAARPTPCPDLLPGGACPADVGAAVATCCDCGAFPNHGQYVRCVAHATNALRKAGCLDQSARTSLKRCAARSTCGKPGFVTCCRSVAGVCLEGTCVGTDPAVTCTTNEECPIKSRCSIKHDADSCLAVGGTPGTASSCCNACAP